MLIESTVTIDQYNPVLSAIAREARAGLPVFFRHMIRPEAGESHFYIKHPFTEFSEMGVSTEQIWLTDIRFRDGRYYGALANNPVFLSGMRRGDTVHFSADEVTDWMFLRNGEIVGGQSIKYLLQQIPEEQRTDSQNNLLQMFSVP